MLPTCPLPRSELEEVSRSAVKTTKSACNCNHFYKSNIVTVNIS